MCVSCGCNQPDVQVHPEDITASMILHAASAEGLSLVQVAENIAKWAGVPVPAPQVVPAVDVLAALEQLKAALVAIKGL